jgi:hypothetical protein
MSFAVLGLLVAGIFSPSAYRATGRLRVDLNLGGIPTNSSYDANGDAVRIVQPNIEQATRLNLSGATGRDPGAVSRIRCHPDRADRIVTCMTTSSDQAAATTAIDQLFSTFIPINVQSQIGEFHVLIRDLQEQYRKDKVTERALVSQIRNSRHRYGGTRIPESKASYQIGSLKVLRGIQKGILAHIAAAHRQITGVSGTLHIYGTTESSAVTSPAMYAIGGGVGLALGLLLGALLVLRGGIRRPTAAQASGGKSRATGRKTKPLPES